MNMKTRNALLLLVALLGLSGCLMTREGFMAKLNSNDPKERKWAEDVIVRGATDSELGHKRNLKWVEFATSNDLLLRIFEQSWDAEIVSLVASKIDFSKEGAKEKFEECCFRDGGRSRKFALVNDFQNYLQYLSIDALEDKDLQSYLKEKLEREYGIPYRDEGMVYWYIGHKLTDSALFLEKFNKFDMYQGNPGVYRANEAKGWGLAAGFIENVGVDKIEGDDFIKWLLVFDRSTQRIKDILAAPIIENLAKQCMSPKDSWSYSRWREPEYRDDYLQSLKRSDANRWYTNLEKQKEDAEKVIGQLPPAKRKEARAKFDEQCKAVEAKIEAVYKKAEETIEKKYKEAVPILARKLSDEAKYEIVSEYVRGVTENEYDSYFSARGDLESFPQIMVIVFATKDESIKEKICGEVFEHTPYVKWSRGPSMPEGEEVEAQKKIWWSYNDKLKETISAEGIARILVAKPNCYYTTLKDRVTPDVAIAVLKSKKMKSRNVEIELCKMMPSAKITLELVACVQTAEGRKILKNAMPAEVKEANATSTKAKFDEVMKKAEVAAQSTFMLAGFYLGMNQDDMKTALNYHFPDIELTLKEKDEGKEFYVSSQKTVFAVTDKNGKVCQFTFGENMLKKWYKYDVQNYEEWIHAYEKEHNARFVFKLRKLNNDRFRFRQDSYQYTNNAKKYTLIYFGDRELETLPSFNSGSGDMFAGLGDVFSAEQVNDYKRDPGSLRVFDDKEDN